MVRKAFCFYLFVLCLAGSLFSLFCFVVSMATFLDGICHSGDPSSDEACGMSLVIFSVTSETVLSFTNVIISSWCFTAGKSKEGTSVFASSRTTHRDCARYNHSKSVPSTFHLSGQIAEEPNYIYFSFLVELHSG